MQSAGPLSSFATELPLHMLGGRGGVYWTNPANPPTGLSVPPADTSVNISAVAPNGNTVGSVHDSTGHSHAAFWASPTSAPTVLPEQAGTTGSSATAISFAGEIVGSRSCGTNSSSTQSWTPQLNLIALPTIGGVNNIDGIGVSSAGLVLGRSRDSDYSTPAVLHLPTLIRARSRRSVRTGVEGAAEHVERADRGVRANALAVAEK